MARMIPPRVASIACSIVVAWSAGGCKCKCNYLVGVVAFPKASALLFTPSFPPRLPLCRSSPITARSSNHILLHQRRQRGRRPGRRRCHFPLSGRDDNFASDWYWNHAVLSAAVPRNDDDDKDYDDSNDSIERGEESSSDLQSSNSSNDEVDDDGSRNDSDNTENVTRQRQFLEKMATNQANNRSRKSDDIFSSNRNIDIKSNRSTAPTVLTTSRRQRLQREIHLLKQLESASSVRPEDDDYDHPNREERVISELWSLWYGERGSQNEKKLIAIEMLVHGGASASDGDRIPPEWTEAEMQYVALIREHCSTTDIGDLDSGKKIGAASSMDIDNLNLSIWIEPANRLATLLFLMGRYQESKLWCERILAAKPWHIGALSGIVMVCANMGDVEGVTKYSKLILPQRTTNVPTSEWIGARSEWVRRNVQLAEANLSHLEESNRRAYETLLNDVINIDSVSECDSIDGYDSSNGGGTAAEYNADSSAWQ